jgi:ASC-1-like (ASCH) protein
LDKEAKRKASRAGDHNKFDIDSIIKAMIKERKGVDRYRKIFEEIDVNGNGVIDSEEFVKAYTRINPDVSLVQLEQMFREADLDGNGTLDFDEFVEMVKLPQVEVLGKLSVQNRDDRGLAQVMPSEEKYFGEELRKQAPEGTGAFLMSQSQHLVMELYESRIASMQRFVAMTVLFHQMGSRVQNFFRNISFGYLGYRMDRTHSIMRIATTASPVSGADVRDRMVELLLRHKIQKAVNLCSRMYIKWRHAKYGINLSRGNTPLSEKSE